MSVDSWMEVLKFLLYSCGGIAVGYMIGNLHRNVRELQEEVEELKKEV